jgi:hypothetical protein
MIIMFFFFFFCYRTVSDGYRLNTYIRIVRLLLEDDNATNAESYLNRASLLIPESKDEVSLTVNRIQATPTTIQSNYIKLSKITGYKMRKN